MQSFRDTLSETFSLSLSSDPSLTTMICRLCIYRLNDASEFKSMVAQSERLLLSKVEGTTSKEDVATSVDKSSGVKTEESEQSTQENEQNDNATNNSTCKDDVGEKTDGQNAAKDDQENVDSTSVDSLSLLKRVYNYIPRNRKTCTKCEGKQNNVVKKTNNYNKSVKSLRLKKEYAQVRISVDEEEEATNSKTEDEDADEDEDLFIDKDADVK
ncbi:zinc-finger associated domain (zf-AD) domain-containing protein [Phthorimaea operculella]|nr:zinc-finger associated domain (zf-AD) domain-containing protein [Phthorimaea operculella]